MYPRHEMLELVVVDGRARGIVTRDMVTGEIESHVADVVISGYRRLRQRLLPLHQRPRLQRHRDLARATSRAPRSPTRATRRSIRPASRSSGDYQSKLTLMSESLRNDGRVWVPLKRGRRRARRSRFPRTSATTILERKYPSFGNLAPRDVASRSGEGGVRRRPRRRPRRARRLPRLLRRHRAAGRATSSASATATSSRCTSASPATTPTKRRCASTRAATTRWAASGWTTT